MTPFPSMTPPPAAPSRSDPPETFIAKADSFVAWQLTFREEVAQFMDYDESVFVTRDGAGSVNISLSAAGSIFNAFTVSNPVQTSAGTGVALYFDPNGAGSNARSASIRSTQTVSGNNADLGFYTADGSTPLERLKITHAGVVQPGADNAQTFGTGSLRWSVLYAATGTINTSDERDKVWRGTASAAELRAAKRIASELGFYQWADAVAEKGGAARYHFGACAQQVWSIMADEGLVDPVTDGQPADAPYAFLCFDEWEATPEVPAVDEVLGEDGEVITPAQMAVPGRDAGNRFGLRIDQLTLFLIAAQEQRLSALEAAL